MTCRYTAQGNFVCDLSLPHAQFVEEFEAQNECTYIGAVGTYNYGCETKIPGKSCNVLCKEKTYTNGFNSTIDANSCQCRSLLNNCSYEASQNNSCNVSMCATQNKVLTTDMPNDGECTCCHIPP